MLQPYNYYGYATIEMHFFSHFRLPFQLPRLHGKKILHGEVVVQAVTELQAQSLRKHRPVKHKRWVHDGFHHVSPLIF